MAVIFVIENFRVQNYRISMGRSILCENLKVCNSRNLISFLRNIIFSLANLSLWFNFSFKKRVKLRHSILQHCSLYQKIRPWSNGNHFVLAGTCRVL